jgi:hypothetical protein
LIDAKIELNRIKKLWKEQGAWLKLMNTCLASTRPRVQRKTKTKYFVKKQWLTTIIPALQEAKTTRVRFKASLGIT